MSQRPLPYWCGVSGRASGSSGSLYERKMKWWAGLDSVGFATKSRPKMTSSTRGSVHVCLRAKCLQRCTRERALRRLEKRLAPSFSWAAAAADAADEDDTDEDEGSRMAASPVPRLGAPVSPARISWPSPLDFLRRRALLSPADGMGSADELKAGNGSGVAMMTAD